jgi:D-amino-acid dehydrogenase
VVVGGGIVGLNIAFFLCREGFSVTVVHGEPLDDTTASGSASAIAASAVLPHATPGMLIKVPGWLLDPLGPLSIRWAHLPRLVPWLFHFLRSATNERRNAGARALAALHRSAFDDHNRVLDDAHLTHLLRRDGQLHVYRSESAWQADASDRAFSQELGYELEPLHGAELRAREPALGPIAQYGCFDPNWAYFVDPVALISGIANHLHERGATLIHRYVSDFVFSGGRPSGVITGDNERIVGDRFVVTAGAWSGALARKLGDTFPLESERGYNTTLHDPGIEVGTYMSFPEEHFVLTPLAGALRIGGAAEFGGLTSAPNYARSDALLRLAAGYLPGLKTEGGTQWMGHRPQSPDTVPVIDRSRSHSNIFYAFGHGHLGLTESATTGRLITSLVTESDPGIDMAPYRIDRFR